MYGGHITDDWDRRLCRTYLEEFIKPEMMEGELYLAPGFRLPGNMDYNGYHQVKRFAKPGWSCISRSVGHNECVILVMITVITTDLMDVQ